MEKLLKKSPNTNKIWSLLIMSLSGFPNKHLNGKVNSLKDHSTGSQQSKMTYWLAIPYRIFNLRTEAHLLKSMENEKKRSLV